MPRLTKRCVMRGATASVDTHTSAGVYAAIIYEPMPLHSWLTGQTGISLDVSVQGPACVDAVATLVELGADTTAVADPSRSPVDTPLSLAVRTGRADIIARLLKTGISVQTLRQVTLACAAVGQHIVQIVLAGASVLVDAGSGAALSQRYCILSQQS